MNNINLASALVFEPRKAFAELAERPRFWFPLLVVALVTTGVALWYLNVVDLAWLTDQQLRHGPMSGRLTEEQITAAVRAAPDRRGVQMTLTGIVTPLGVVVGVLLAALINLLTAKITNVQYGYRHWFSLACWTNLPTVLAQVASAFVLLTASTTQLSQADLQPLSLNSLLFHLETGATGYTLLTYVSVVHFWVVFLAMLAVKQWSGRSWLFSFLFTMWLPLLGLGIWALIKIL